MVINGCPGGSMQDAWDGSRLHTRDLTGQAVQCHYLGISCLMETPGKLRSQSFARAGAAPLKHYRILMHKWKERGKGSHVQGELIHFEHVVGDRVEEWKVSVKKPPFAPPKNSSIFTEICLTWLQSLWCSSTFLPYGCLLVAIFPHLTSINLSIFIWPSDVSFSFPCLHLFALQIPQATSCLYKVYGDCPVEFQCVIF